MNSKKLKADILTLCRRIGKRNFIIIGTVLLCAAAIAVNVVIVTGTRDDGFSYDQSAGMNVGSSGSSGNEEGNEEGKNEDSVDSYFSSVQLNRQRTRDEAIEVLTSVLDNTASTEAARNEASEKIGDIAKIMETEANIETLIVAKGFTECVAVISDGGASIVVKSDGLLPAQISQINEIVYSQAGIEPAGITIIER